MKTWQLNVPDTLYTGINSIENLETIVSNKNKTFVVIDPNVEKTCFGNRAKDLLSGKKVVYFSDFTSDPSEEEVIKGAKKYIEKGCSEILSIGGGSAIDISKAIGLVGENNYNIENIYEDEKLNEKFPRFICIPTTCGTGAEASPYSIISDRKSYRKKNSTRRFYIPNEIILDVDAIESLNKFLIGATCLDTLVHAIEVHMSNFSDDLVRIQTAGSLYMLGKSLNNNLSDEKLHENLLSIALTSRMLFPKTGLSLAHAIAHPLGSYTGLHHGVTVGILLEEVIKYNYNFAKEHIIDATFLLCSSRDVNDLYKLVNRIIIDFEIDKYSSEYLKDKKIDINFISKESMRSSNISSSPRSDVTRADIKGIITSSLNKYI